MSSAAEIIHEARTAGGLTQAEFARRAGVTQSVISAYETGRREPSFATLRRMVAAADCILATSVIPAQAQSTLDLVREHAAELRARLGALGAVDVRVFGSVARREETSTSDIDLLVELDPGVGLFALLQMQSAAEAILGRSVDIVPSDALKADAVDNVRRDSVPL